MSRISEGLPPPWPNQALALSKEASQSSAREEFDRVADKGKSGNTVDTQASAKVTPAGEAGDSATEHSAGGSDTAGSSKVNVVV